MNLSELNEFCWQRSHVIVLTWKVNKTITWGDGMQISSVRREWLDGNVNNNKDSKIAAVWNWGCSKPRRVPGQRGCHDALRPAGASSPLLCRSRAQFSAAFTPYSKHSTWQGPRHGVGAQPVVAVVTVAVLHRPSPRPSTNSTVITLAHHADPGRPRLAFCQNLWLESYLSVSVVYRVSWARRQHGQHRDFTLGKPTQSENPTTILSCLLLSLNVDPLHLGCIYSFSWFRWTTGAWGVGRRGLHLLFCAGL